jgi:hypothetical protein
LSSFSTIFISCYESVESHPFLPKKGRYIPFEDVNGEGVLVHLL